MSAQPSSYTFPLNIPESYSLFCKGALVKTASLFAGGILLSNITVNYTDHPMGQDKEMLLNFLGGSPIHGALLPEDAKVIITIQDDEPNIPSLVFQVFVGRVTWDTVEGPVYRSQVCVGGIQKTLVYCRDGRVGYERSATIDAQKS